MFSPGDEVECIKDEMSGDYIKVGRIYKVIHWKPPGPHDTGDDRQGYISLEGVMPNGPGFWGTRFRKVSTGPQSKYSNVDFGAITRGICSG